MNPEPDQSVMSDLEQQTVRWNLRNAIHGHGDDDVEFTGCACNWEAMAVEDALGLDPSMSVARLRSDLAIAAAVRKADTQYAVLYNLLDEALLTELFGDEPERSHP
jgi:hypothetical protein